jgi:ABC-2 type transport system ATP-binding protein
MSSTTIIKTQGLTYRYGDFTAIKGVNLDVYQGEIFGFLGPNGAGKTTTIRTILDFIRPTAGTVTVFGKDARNHSVDIRRRIGYLPSELKLWENWRGRDYVRWLSDVHGKDLMPEARRLADALQYDLDRSLKGMSTGMKRKMGLIAAMAHRPELLILDEPTNGLDPLMQKVFHKLMLEARNEGRTIFMSSHMLTEVEQICDRVGIIRTGQLRAIEDVEKLMRLSFRWLTVTLKRPAEQNGFGSINGVTELAVDGHHMRMKVGGEADMDRVVKELARYPVDDIEFARPTLEEIFLAYYGEKEA